MGIRSKAVCRRMIARFGRDIAQARIKTYTERYVRLARRMMPLDEQVTVPTLRHYRNMRCDYIYLLSGE